MKLMTVNTHSLVGEDFPLRAEAFFESILLELPDVIAMQEVNQTPDAPVVDSDTVSRFVSSGVSIPLREDNYAYWLWRKLSEEGISYYWTWFPIKRGYGRYDEGLATFSRLPIDAVETVYLSPNRDYEDWHTRAALAIQCGARGEWFYNAHMSRWSGQGGFMDEWNRLKGSFSTKESLWLMGDLNNPAEVRDEGYDTVTKDGFFDAYLLAKDRSGEATARRGIDGWGDGNADDGLRIDHVWCSERREILRYRTVFDGKDLPVVSDHFGVIVEAEFKQGRGGF